MDDATIERARRGEAEAMEGILLAVTPVVERFVRRMCPGREADDVLQETLLSVLTHLDRFEGRSAFTSWVFALTRSACSRRHRGQKNQPHEGDDTMATLADVAPDPETRVADGELTEALARALQSLSPEHREVIVLRDIDGLTAPEAATTLGISVEALKSRLHRARAALREALRPVLETHTPPSPSRCPDVLSLWSRRLEGDLSPADCAEMERHLEGCPACNAACNALKHTLWACQQQAKPVVSETTRAAIRRALDAALATR